MYKSPDHRHNELYHPYKAYTIDNRVGKHFKNHKKCNMILLKMIINCSYNNVMFKKESLI